MDGQVGQWVEVEQVEAGTIPIASRTVRPRGGVWERRLVPEMTTRRDE